MAAASLPAVVAVAAPSPPRRGADNGCSPPLRGCSSCPPPSSPAAPLPPWCGVDNGCYSHSSAWQWWRLLPSSAWWQQLPPHLPDVEPMVVLCTVAAILICEYFENFVIWDVDLVIIVWWGLAFLGIKFMSSRLNLAFSCCFWLSCWFIDLGI